MLPPLLPLLLVSWLPLARPPVPTGRGPARRAHVALMDPAELLRQSEVLEVLSRVQDPSLADLESGRVSEINVVSLGLVKRVDAAADGSIVVDLQLSSMEAAASGSGERLGQACEDRLAAELEWAGDVHVNVQIVRPTEPATQLSPAGTAGAVGGGLEASGVGGVKKIVAVASCKARGPAGGSTVNRR